MSENIKNLTLIKWVGIFTFFVGTIIAISSGAKLPIAGATYPDTVPTFFVGTVIGIIGLLISLIPIYILNLLRNASVAWLVGEYITNFFIAHNVLSKIGALITLIVILYFVIKIIPEIFDEIICLTNLPKRKGPLERMFKLLVKKSK